MEILILAILLIECLLLPIYGGLENLLSFLSRLSQTSESISAQAAP